MRLNLLLAPLLLTLCTPAFCQSTKADWQTPAEKSNYATTPDYADTMAYINRVAAAAPGMVKVEPFGKTGEGRVLNIVIVSRDGNFDPGALHAAKRPILLVQNSIHAGEMDGKDSCLALLRDLAIDKKFPALLERAVFVFIPVYNIDGHERRSAYNRINQNGPDVMGWRGNGSNLNLNRDYMKADAPETRALLAMFHRWLPDFFVDDHVTDGSDYQYDVTFGIDDTPDVAPQTAAWASGTVTPYLEKFLDAHGHLASPFINLVDENDPSKGLSINDDPPRFSTGYMVLEGRPGMLVELHMLKDYKTRVTGNYEILRGLLEVMNRDADKLIAVNAEADREAEALGSHPRADFPLSVDWDGKTTTPFLFHGYKYTREKSDISGSMWVKYTHTPMDVTVPLQTGTAITAAVHLPAAYIIPAQWTHVIDVLAAHQVAMQRTTAEWTGDVESYHCTGMQWNRPPFEGRHPIFEGEGAGKNGGKFGTCETVQEKRTFPAGSAVVELNQRLSRVAAQWLEPVGPDSAVRWGFFDPVFEQKEYGEPYVTEKLAREMIATDPALKAEFDKKVADDPQFAANPFARLEFFYDRSPWGKANRVGEYPVGRLTSVSGIPLQ